MIDKLEFLIALARERNFSRAAEVCGVTQPTLSAGIKQLEETLGVVLVNRSSRYYGLTAEGERALEWGKRIVSDARAMRQDLFAAKTPLAGHLTLAAVPTALPLAAELTIPFRLKHPGVRFTILSKTSREILSMLEDFQIDAGLTYLDNEPLGDLPMVALCHERYQLLTRAGSPLGERDKVTWSDVARIPLCLLTPDMQNRRIIDRLLVNRAAPPPLEFELHLGVVFARPDRWLRLCRLRKTGGSAQRERTLARNSHRRTRENLHDRARFAAPRAYSAAHQGIGRRGESAGDAGNPNISTHSPLIEFGIDRGGD